MSNKKKVLIIDDEPVLLEAIAKKLDLEGYDIVTALDGVEGLEKIKKENPDVILLDILMPKMNGMELIEEVNKDSKLSKIPIIIISNSGQPVEIEKAMSLGVRDYLIKAEFDPNEVLAKVNNVLMGEGNVEKDSEDADGDEEDENNKAAKGSELSKKILIIEDDQLLRDLCSRKMISEGFNVNTAVDPREGLKKVASFKPDLVLLDLVLPGMSGFDVLKNIKSNKDKSIADTPVVILSNLGQESDMQKGKELGATDYLIKATTTTDEIVRKVRNVLGIKLK